MDAVTQVLIDRSRDAVRIGVDVYVHDTGELGLGRACQQNHSNRP